MCDRRFEDPYYHLLHPDPGNTDIDHLWWNECKKEEKSIVDDISYPYICKQVNSNIIRRNIKVKAVNKKVNCNLNPPSFFYVYIEWFIFFLFLVIYIFLVVKLIYRK
jgi:hypothetical protein